MGGNKKEQGKQTLGPSVLSSRDYELYLDQMSDLAYFTDDQGNMLWVNAAVAEAFERPKEELLGKPFLSYFIPEERESVKATYEKILEGNPVEATWTLVSGKTCCFSSQPYRDEAGNIIGTFGVGENLTERLKIELALRDSEERFKAIHDASFGGIVIHDKGLILECNQGLSDITGFDYDELIGMNGLLLISDKTRPKVVENITNQYEEPYEAEGVRKNGETYPLRLEARQIPYKGKEVRVVEFRDLTKEKESEKEKLNLEKQLQQAQKLEAVGRLAGGVAHDFNNMLTAILGNAELALAKIDEKSALFLELKEIEKAARRSAGLTRQLLAFSRKQTISPKVINLNDTLADLTKMLARLIGEEITLNLELDDEPWNIKVDPGQIDQILTNLCINAKDAIGSAGNITIRTQKVLVEDDIDEGLTEIAKGEYVKLTVKDSGCGMDKDTVAHIFEPFFTTKEIGKGTGLGLATVYGAVRQNKGYIRVNSALGQGTSFDLFLPRYGEGKTEIEANRMRILTNQGTETILVVEDERAILDVTAKQLNKLGYSVIAANGPAEAIKMATDFNGPIDLLITDVVMPDMNGNELSKEIASIYPESKVLFMSGYTADVIANHGVLREGIRFLEKPFSFEDLGSSVREALDD